MQVFVPLTTFRACAKALDRARLGKQRLEAKQILLVLLSQRRGSWAQHPATQAWKGFEGALTNYAIEICKEWRRRGYKDSQLRFFLQVQRHLTNFALPPWWGDLQIHASHRAALLWKAEGRYVDTGKDDELIWYEAFKWVEAPLLKYKWPTKHV